MSLSNSTARVLLATTVAVALLAGSGCTTLHLRREDGSLKFMPKSHNNDYTQSKENRPLDVPPDLDTPATDPTMQIPGAHGGGSRAAGMAPSSANPGFSLTDTPAGAWDRMGKALERINGVTISQRSQLLNSYEVQYKGASMLLRANPDGASTHVDVVGADNQPIRSPEAIELLNLLRDRLS
jgi:uncharacterized lipoprotein